MCISNLKLIMECFSFGGRKKPEITTESTEKRVSSERSVTEDSWLRKITINPCDGS